MRALPLLPLGGAAAGIAVVVGGGQVGPLPGSVRLTGWLGLQAADAVDPATEWWPGALMTAGMATLVALWLVALRLRLGQRQIWKIAGWWSAPLILGPPVLSSDVYTYVAQGLMTVHGFDPYHGGPNELGSLTAVRAVDPTWRGVPSPYGPLATLVERLAVQIGGGAVGGILVLRLLAVLSVVGLGVFGVRLVARERRPLVLTLLVLNPLVLLQVVSAVHFEGLMTALTVAALLALRRGHPRLAIVLAFAAGAVKAPALVVVLAVAAAAVIGLRWRDAIRDLLVSATVATACAAVMSLAFPPDAWGWIKALETPTQGRTPIAPATLLSDLLGHIVPFAANADVEQAGRIASLGLAGCIVLALLLTVAHRPLPATAGLALLAVALLGPVLYPWYLLWGLVCLAPFVRGRQISWYAAVSVIGAMTKLWGLTTPANVAVTAAVLVGAAIVAFGRPFRVSTPLRTVIVSPELS